MTERAAHLVDAVLPDDVPLRQWVLSVPHALRYRLAYDHTLCRAVLRAFVRTVFAFYRRRARRAGVPAGQTGSVTAVQRFGGAVNLHIHSHTLALDGVVAPAADGTPRFHPAPPPTDAEVERVLAAVNRRIAGVLERRGLGTDTDAPDPLEDECRALAGLAQAAVRGRAALGHRAGRGPLRLGADPEAPWVERGGPLHAQHEGFDLHAAVQVPGEDRDRRERLCRYLFRPPIGQHRLQRLHDGRIAVALQRAWADGTTHLVFAPQERLERLVPLIPRPGINLEIYHGVLAPNARWRAAVVPAARGKDEAAAFCSAQAGDHLTPEPALAPPRRRPRYRAWADLMRRAFALDVLACPRCGGRCAVIATIDDPAVVRKILTHLGLSLDPGDVWPVRPP